MLAAREADRHFHPFRVRLGMSVRQKVDERNFGFVRGIDRRRHLLGHRHLPDRHLPALRHPALRHPALRHLVYHRRRSSLFLLDDFSSSPYCTWE